MTKCAVIQLWYGDLEVCLGKSDKQVGYSYSLLGVPFCSKHEGKVSILCKHKAYQKCGSFLFRLPLMRRFIV